MASSFEQHRQAVTRYFEAPPDAPIVLSEQERAGVYAFLYRLYDKLGSLNGIITLFHRSLDAYWKVAALPAEEAFPHEGSTWEMIQRILAARQFSRAPASVIGTYISQSAIDTTRYWHPFYDPYPPANVDQMPEPYRAFFLLLDELFQEMNARGDPHAAMLYLSGVMAGFCQTVPLVFFDMDEDFQGYTRNQVGVQVGGKLVDDDYTFYLSKIIVYSLFDRFR